MFYNAVVQSLISFCVIVLGGNLACKEVCQFDRVAMRVSRMTDVRQSCFVEILDKFCLRKIEAIIKDKSHPCHDVNFLG